MCGDYIANETRSADLPDPIAIPEHCSHRIHWSALLSDVRYVQYWIEQRGEDVNVKDAYGITPLHLAVWAGNFKIVSSGHFLLDNEFSFNCAG